MKDNVDARPNDTPRNTANSGGAASTSSSGTQPQPSSPQKSKKRTRDQSSSSSSGGKQQASAEGSSSSSKTKKAKKEYPASLSDDLDISKFHCVVCLDYPPKEIYQCRESHLLCAGCHKRIIESVNAKCPSCRLKLSRDHPTRNRIAEHTLSKFVVDCSNEGCNQRVKYGELQTHVEEQCPHRKVQCKYHHIGCTWKGKEKEQKKHQRKQCDLKDASAKKILKRVIAKKEDEEKKSQSAKQLATAQVKLHEMLSGRAKNIHVHDVVVNSLRFPHREPDENFDYSCSDIFRMFGTTWEAVLEPIDKASNVVNMLNEQKDVPEAPASAGFSFSSSMEIDSSSRESGMGCGGVAGISGIGGFPSALFRFPVSPRSRPFSTRSRPFSTRSGPQNRSSSSSNGNRLRSEFNNVPNQRVGFRLRCVGVLKRKLRLEIVVMSGPELGLSITPTFHKEVFRQPDNRNSDIDGKLFELSCSESEATEILESESVNLRIIVTNKNNGSDRSFSTRQRTNDRRSILMSDSDSDDTDDDSSSDSESVSDSSSDSSMVSDVDSDDSTDYCSHEYDVVL